MSNLIPEKRVNKNGVAVIKHVRPDAAAGKSVKLPVPSVGTATVRPATPLLEGTLATSTSYMKNVGQEPLDFTLDDLDPSAAQVLEVLLKADEEMHPTSYVIQSGVTSALGRKTREEGIAYIHNIAVFGALIAGTESRSISGFLNGLNHYPDPVLTPNQDYLLEVDEDQRNRALSLMKFTVSAYDSDLGGLVRDSFMESFGLDEDVEIYLKLADDELADYVLRNPEQSEAIMDLLTAEGRALPAGIIEGRLNHEVQAMRDGFL